MIRDITIGQYYQGESFIHNLDPRVKILTSLGYMIALFIFNSPIEYLVMTLLLAGVVLYSKVPFTYILKGMKPVSLLLLMTAIMKILFTRGESNLFEYGIIFISTKGIYESIYLAVRLVLLVISASMLTYTTTPNMLTDGLEKVLVPLKIFKVNVTDLAMMMTIALRFIPILVEETDKIIKAQVSRGADFENGGLAKKVKNLMPLLVPLFVAAFRRAADLATAMEARCYGFGIKRTKMKPLKLKKNDYKAIAVIIMALALLIAVKIIK